jgi:hypothetical protein
MAVPNVIQGWDDACQPTITNMAEALEKLRSLGCDLETGRCWIHVPAISGKAALVARLFFSTAHGDQVRLDLPMLEGCRGWTTLGAPRYVPLEAFDQAEVDGRGNVSLQDGTSVHAVDFDTIKFPEFTDLEEVIIWLTIRAFKAEHMFVRRGPCGVIGIDYGILHILREPNVKELAIFINEHIGKLPRYNGKPAFGFVPTATIQRTLDLAGIGKVRGRKRRKAA